MGKLVYLLLFICPLIVAQSKEPTIKTSCRPKKRLISSVQNELFQLIEVNFNEAINLECHYCFQLDNSDPKVWFKIDPGSNVSHEVQLSMHNDDTLNKISVSDDHTLIIDKVSLEDIGKYYCQSIENLDSERFNYGIDVIFSNLTSPEKGDLSHWRQYHDDYLSPINKQFTKSDESDYALIRNELETDLEIFTDWEMEWGPCEICGRPQGEGVQEKYGHCRIKIENSNKTLDLNAYDNPKYLLYFLTSSKISCKSLLLEKLFSNISNITKWLPDFVLVQKCDGICNPDAAGLNSGWKFGKSKGYKYRKTAVLNEGSHFTAICPESTLDNTVTWRRNGKVLEQGDGVVNEDQEIPHVVVDAFNSLYLIDVAPDDDGNYTCQVDEIRMQQLRVFVVAKSRLVSKEFLRHMMYLAFILLMTSSCYCAGLVVTCKRKYKFKTYSDIVASSV